MKPSNLRARLLTIPIVLVTATGGCMVGVDEGPTYKSSLKAITKTKWLSCWVRPTTDTGDPFFQSDTLQCSAAFGEGPLSPQLIVMNTKDQNTFVYGRIDKPGTVDIGRFQRSSYPHSIDVQVIPDTRGLASRLETLNGFVMNMKFDRFDQYTMEKPLVIEQPVDIWPIEITVQGDIFVPALEPYTVTLAPGVKVAGGYNETLDTISASSRFGVMRHGETKTVYVPAPRGARRPLAGNALVLRTSTERVKFELDGPGAYIATEKGLQRKPDAGASSGMGTSTHMLDSCPGSWSSDDLCDRCLSADPACNVNGVPGCEAQWRGDSICDECLGDDPDCATGGECPASWRGDGICDTCLGNDPDCAMEECHDYWIDDGVCDPCLGSADHTDCTAGITCPSAWRNDGTCDVCLGDDPDCEDVDCPASWNGDGICDECLGDDPDCAGPACPAEWRNDGICDECLGDDPDCTPECPMEWYGDGFCDECLINDSDCEGEEECPWSWYNDGLCDPCLGDDPDCL